jgi:hypothetical protein
VRAQPVHSQDAKGEQDTPAQVGDAEDIQKLLKHELVLSF